MGDRSLARGFTRKVLPDDLVAVLLVTGLLLVSVTVPLIRETPFRLVVSIPVVLFVPGYTVMAALFPEKPAGAEPQQSLHSTVTYTERFLLSVGTSIAVVPMIGVLATFTPWGLTMGSIVAGITTFIIIWTAIAAYRRQTLPPDQRFSVPIHTWMGAGKERFFTSDTKTDILLNAMIVVGLFFVAASVGYAVTGPQQGDQFTEFSILTENETGELVADGYPTDFERGESDSVVVSVSNHEYELTSYSVVLQLQDAEQTAVNDTTMVVRERETLDVVETGELAHDETWRRETDIEPTMTGEQLRLVFLLYQETPPDEPTGENAYREVSLWITVTES